MRTIAVVALLFILFSPVVFGQGIDIHERTGKSRVYFGISVLPAQSKVIDEGSGLGLEQTPANTISGSMELGILVKGWLSISIGLRYSSFEQGLKLAQINGTYLTPPPDSDNDNYQLRWTGTNVQETQKLSFVGVPVCIGFQIPLSSKVALYAKGGVDICMPITQSYSTKGVFSYAGYYPEYNVTISNLPDYGFPSDLNTSVTGKLIVKSVNLNPIFSVGGNFRISQHVLITLGAFYTYSMSSIYASDGSTSSTELTTAPSTINSIMALGSKASVQAIGISLGLIFMRK
jgi:hypothetical protein